MALAGCNCSDESGPATWPWAPISARTSSPSRSAVSRLVTTRAAAPSEIGLDDPAVMVPSGRNAGLSAASDSTLTPSRTPSSAATTRSGPRRCGTCTGNHLIGQRARRTAIAALGALVGAGGERVLVGPGHLDHGFAAGPVVGRSLCRSVSAPIG